MIWVSPRTDQQQRVLRPWRAEQVALAMTVCAAALFVTACHASATVPHPVISTSTKTYQRGPTERCLTAHRAFVLDIPKADFASWINPLLPPGVEGDLTVVGPTNGFGASKPLPKLMAPVDNVTLYFFSNPDLARKGVARLARFHYYGDGVPERNRTPWELHPPPKSAAATLALQEVAGNVAIFWQYPRHRANYSNRLVTSCLRG